jgi:hypothetical protein
MKIIKAKWLLTSLFLFFLCVNSAISVFVLSSVGLFIFDVDGMREFANSNDRIILTYMFISFVVAVLMSVKFSLKLLFFVIESASIFDGCDIKEMLGEEVFKMYEREIKRK